MQSDEVIGLYSEGKSILSIAGIAGCSFTKIRNVLLSRGVVIRPSSVKGRVFSDIHKMRLSATRRRQVANGELFGAVTRQRMSVAQKAYAVLHPERSRLQNWTDVQRAAASERAKGNKNRVGRCENDNFKKKISVAVKATILKKGVLGLREGDEVSRITRRKMQIARVQYLVKNKSYPGRPTSDCELKVLKQLEDCGVQHVHQYSLKDVYAADFYLPQYKLIVECDGGYWHLLPKKKSRDKNMDELAMILGKKVLRLSEEKIMSKNFNVLSEINLFLSSIKEVCL